MPQSKQIHERTITEITDDGCIIEKKIVEYPSEETTEIEEIEEVDGKIMSVKRSVIGEKKEEPSRPKTLAKLDNEPVLLVPGCRTVMMDENTNSTTVTEKTTTGYKQTVTITQEDGTKKIQTKTFFDPVEIPGEESYEEIEILEPGWKKTIVKSIQSVDTEPISEPSIFAKEENKSTLSSGLKNIVIVPGHRKVEFDEKSNTTTVTEKTTTGYQQTIITVTPDGNTVHTKVFYDPIPGEETCEDACIPKPTTKTIQTKSSTKNSHVVESVISGRPAEKAETDKVRQQVKEEQIQPFQKQEHKIVTKNVRRVESNSTKTTYVNDLQIVPAEPISRTQKITTPDGKTVEVEFTVSDGGKTKTLRKVVRQPSEEIEIEEYEETQTHEPGEVKVITTAKLIPFVDEVEESRKHVTDNADTVVETTRNSQTITHGEQQEKSQIDVISKTASKTTTMQHRAEVKYQVNVCAKVSETKTESKQSTSEANRTSTEETQTYTKIEKVKANAYASINSLTSKMNAKSTTQTLSGESTAVSKESDSQITSENSTETI